MGIDLSRIREEVISRVIDTRFKRGEMTILKVDNRPIGIAAINARYKDSCQIGSVYVDMSYRERGYGALLLSEHFKKLFKIYNRIVLFVRSNNETAYNLYKKLGFKVKGELGQIMLKK